MVFASLSFVEQFALLMGGIMLLRLAMIVALKKMGIEPPPSPASKVMGFVGDKVKEAAAEKAVGMIGKLFK